MARYIYHAPTKGYWRTVKYCEECPYCHYRERYLTIFCRYYEGNEKRKRKWCGGGRNIVKSYSSGSCTTIPRWCPLDTKMVST